MNPSPALAGFFVPALPYEPDPSSTATSPATILSALGFNKEARDFLVCATQAEQRARLKPKDNSGGYRSLYHPVFPDLSCHPKREQIETAFTRSPSSWDPGWIFEGLMGKSENYYFAPAESITRLDFAVIIQEIFKDLLPVLALKQVRFPADLFRKKITDTDTFFSSIPTTSTVQPQPKDAAEQTVRGRLLLVDEQRKFYPKKPLLRGDLYRALLRLVVPENVPLDDLNRVWARAKAEDGFLFNVALPSARFDEEQTALPDFLNEEATRGEVAAGIVWVKKSFSAAPPR